jgi:hypothetical protein
MKNLLLAAPLLILFANPAYAQSTKAAHKALLFSTAAQTGDLISTLTANQWQQRETNTLIPTSNTGLILTKAATATLNYFGSTRALRKHPKLIFWMQTSLGSGLTYVTYRNLRNK